MATLTPLDQAAVRQSRRAPAPAVTPARRPAARRAAPASRPAAPTAPAAAAAPATIEEEVRRNYGYMAWALAVPELRSILVQAAQEGWDRNRLQGALSATDWWRATSNTVREWTQRKAEDPASAAQMLAQATLKLRVQAQRIGGGEIADARLSQIAEDSLRFGWDDTQTLAALTGELRYDPARPTSGDIGAIAGKFATLAKLYLVPIAPDVLYDKAKQVAAGSLDEAAFLQYVVDQARSLHPTIARSIDEQNTTRRYFDPYVGLAAHDLEIPADSIDLMDPKWSRAINTIDSATGERRAMGLSEWQTMFRSDPIYGYQYTAGGRQQSYQLADTIAQTFGKVAA